MPYPKHWLLQFGGHQGDVNEEWSCGIRIGITSGLPGAPVDEEDYLDTVAVPGLAGWFQNPDSLISDAARLLTIKFNEIRPDGRYTDQTQVHVRQVNYSGGAAGVQKLHPLQVSCVLSWRSDAAARGPGSHGRIYMPRPYVGVEANGDITGGDRVKIADEAANLLNSLDVTIGVGDYLRPVIVSTLDGGVMNEVNRVVVDSCLDIQRRRAKSQTKEVTSAEVTY